MNRVWPKRIAVVLPRYGESLGGGAETLTKAVLERMVEDAAGEIERAEVWTTCAIDHRTWENELPAGSCEIGGIRVKRFPVDKRNLEIFIRAEHSMRDGMPLTIDQQLDWLANSVNSNLLYEHIAEHGKEFDLILFAPYLFATSFWGALIHPDRSVIIPCLHNEHYAFQEVFAFLFSQVRGLLFNAEPEKELAEQLYGRAVISDKATVVGMGFDRPGDSQGQLPDELRGKRFILYSGRKETGKNLDLLIDGFEGFSQREESEGVYLAIIGSGSIDFRPELPPRVLDLGFVSEETKEALMREAMFLCQPSVNESFSIVMMEAWLRGTACVVHADCAVTRDHVVRSGGGLFFAGREEFETVLSELVANPELCNTLGDAGRRYVERQYSWDAVLSRLSSAFDVCGLLPADSDAGDDQAKQESQTDFDAARGAL
ncbi:MAG: glycosyltransferase family 4 protein [Bdellovibrionales bacterium]|nr:glycosyltransferase family 4 protein [Bdellovibrionales bacterium]